MATEAIRRIPKVFDKYMLPKVAFAMVTGASLAGAVLTGFRHGWTEWPLLLLRWGTYWVMALLLGSEIWKVLYLRPSVRMRPVPGAVEYAEAMITLHRAWQMVLAPLLLALSAAHLIFYAMRHPESLTWAGVATGTLSIALAAIAVGWARPVEAQQQDTASVVSLIFLAASAAALAGLDVILQNSTGSPLWLLVPNRVLHIWAFSAWLGGALWNIAIAVPAGRVRETMESVILANFQLERFRVVVRAVFPTIVLTGLVQVWGMFAWQWMALFTNTWGLLVLAKVGFILALVAVFIACPMWGACSPIRGVCNLDDLYNQEEEE